MEYRILEKRGVFIIQVKDVRTETTGMLWWKKQKQTVVWSRCDIAGYPLTFGRFGYNLPPIQEFKTLKEAQSEAAKLIQPTRIHEIA